MTNKELYRQALVAFIKSEKYEDIDLMYTGHLEGMKLEAGHVIKELEERLNQTRLHRLGLGLGNGKKAPQTN